MVRRSLDLSYGQKAIGCTAGIAIFVIWAVSLICSLLLSVAALAALVAGAYYLFTGEFILQ